MIPMTNAAGQVKLPHEVEPLLALPSDILRAVTLGSYTLEPRAGNSGNVFWDDGLNDPTSLSALGLPNPGIGEALRFLPDLIDKIRASGKRVRVNIAGFDVDEYHELIKACVGIRVDEIEINLGCPNVRNEGVQKPIFAFDPERIAEILTMAHRVSGTLGEPDIAVKLSPYSDPFFLAKVAAVLRTHLHAYMKLVTCNTFPNAYGFIRPMTPAIDANDGYAGLAGHAMKHVALGQVRQFSRLLPSFDIVGVGGISGGRDLREMELAGAKEAQVGTAFFTHGPKAFQRVAMEYADLVD
ncbi:MAG: dihydroorotate dehydrogenase [bacterium]